MTGTPLYAPVLLAALFGLRRSEALGLKWSAINFNTKTITIDTTVVRQHQGNKVVTTVRDNMTKSETSTRSLPLCDFTTKELQRIWHQQQDNRRLCGDCYDEKYLDFVCVSRMGTLINPDYVTQTFAKELEKNNLRHIRFHDLRHTFATLSLKNGVDVKTLSGALGHYSAGFILNVYTHATPHMKREAADTIGNAINREM